MLRNLGSTPDAVARRCALGKLFPTLRPSSLPIVVAQPDKTCKLNNICFGVARQTEHSTTSGSNEEEWLYQNDQRWRGFSFVCTYGSNVTSFFTLIYLKTCASAKL